MDAFQILVIILSVFLAVFLLLSIILVIYLIKVVKAIRQISEKAASVVDSASNITKFVSPTVATKYIFDAVQKAIKNHKETK